MPEQILCVRLHPTDVIRLFMSPDTISLFTSQFKYVIDLHSKHVSRYIYERPSPACVGPIYITEMFPTSVSTKSRHFILKLRIQQTVPAVCFTIGLLMHFTHSCLCIITALKTVGMKTYVIRLKILLSVN